MQSTHDPGPPTTRAWNFASVFEQVASVIPDALALAQGSRRLSWAQFDERANGLARALLDAGVAEQGKVAEYLYNCPEYLETVFACFKAGLVPVNTNYRYTGEELVYLWDNADVTAVVFHAEFADRISAIRALVPRVRLWLWVADGSGPCPPWATPFEDAATAVTDSVVIAPWGRGDDQLMLLYTGGTTGQPKGVMWRQDDVFRALDADTKRWPDDADLDAVRMRLIKAGPRALPGAPLMHGTGLFNALSILTIGGSITTLVGRRLDPVELLDTVQAERINSISIVGDAFAGPIVRALDAEPDRWDISSLRVVFSSGVMWSRELKAGFLRHNRGVVLVDTLGSSEALGIASSQTKGDAQNETAKFTLSDRTRVIDEQGRDVVPGSAQIGRLALRGHTAIGYYKDPEKSAATFPNIDGERYSIPGDFAEVLIDGTVRLLGRGSQCINTGGEKVFPEEVEECLKLHPAVADAAVVGVPDERFGEAVTALVELAPGADDIEPLTLIEHVKSRLAGYKAPKHLWFVPTTGRLANGKLDYRALRDVALTRGLDGAANRTGVQ